MLARVLVYDSQVTANATLPLHSEVDWTKVQQMRQIDVLLSVCTWRS